MCVLNISFISRIQEFIHPFVNDDQSPEACIPQVLLKLENVTVEEGHLAKFMTKITGFPKPRVSWTVNGIPAITVKLIHTYLLFVCNELYLIKKGYQI